MWVLWIMETHGDGVQEIWLCIYVYASLCCRRPFSPVLMPASVNSFNSDSLVVETAAVSVYSFLGCQLSPWSQLSTTLPDTALVAFEGSGGAKSGSTWVWRDLHCAKSMDINSAVK